jgi:hypothetical protein
MALETCAFCGEERPEGEPCQSNMCRSNEETIPPPPDASFLPKRQARMPFNELQRCDFAAANTKAILRVIGASVSSAPVSFGDRDSSVRPGRDTTAEWT